MATCPICQQRIVPASGPISSDVLLVGEFPGFEELQRGVPFVGEAGKILEYELFLVGLNLRGFRLTNLWQHAKPDKMNETSQQCFNHFVVELTKEMRGRKVLLMERNATTFLRWKLVIVQACWWSPHIFRMMLYLTGMCKSGVGIA
jgi:uracil-DNA glycosylase family 4